MPRDLLPATRGVTAAIAEPDDPVLARMDPVQRARHLRDRRVVREILLRDLSARAEACRQAWAARELQLREVRS